MLIVLLNKETNTLFEAAVVLFRSKSFKVSTSNTPTPVPTFEAVYTVGVNGGVQSIYWNDVLAPGDASTLSVEAELDAGVTLTLERSASDAVVPEVTNPLASYVILRLVPGVIGLLDVTLFDKSVIKLVTAD